MDDDTCSGCGTIMQEVFRVDFPDDGYADFCSKECAKNEIRIRIEDFIFTPFI